jgi:uncharacterized protein (DUF1697 family)
MYYYVSFLRGVNVGGKVLKMKELVELYRSIGLEDPRSYIQSGNILFNASEARREGLETELQQRVKDRLAFDVTVIIRTRPQLREIVECNPFTARAGLATKSLYVTLLERSVQDMKAGDLPRDDKTYDEYVPAGTELYLYCPGGYGKTVYSNVYFERTLGMRATTRNWNTINRLLQIAEAPDNR